MNLLELAERNGDKPKKLPIRPPMWMQGATAPSASTATPSVYTTGVGLPNVKNEVVITPKPKDSSAYSPYNFDRDTWGQIGKFGSSLLADPIALGVSAYDFVQDPSLLNAGALGLDAFTPGNVGGLLKGIGEIGIAGAAARELTKKSVGRVVTNLVSTQNYGNKIAELMQLSKEKGIQPIWDAIKNDKPIYNIHGLVEAEGEFPYRKMFGQDVRPITKRGDSVIDYRKVHMVNPLKGIETVPLPIKQADGTYTLNPKSVTYEDIVNNALYNPEMFSQTKPNFDFTMPGQTSHRNFLLGGYNVKWDPSTGTFTANDTWDFNLNKGELKSKLLDIKQSYDYNKKNGKWVGEVFNPNGPSIPGKFVPLDFKDKIEFAKENFNRELIPLALRYAMSKITDPITYKIPVGLNELPDMSRKAFDQRISNQFLKKFGRVVDETPFQYDAPDYPPFEW